MEFGKCSNKFLVGDVVNMLGFGGFQVLLFIFTGFWFFIEASEIMILSLLMPHLKEYFHLSNIEESISGSVVFCGLLFGSIFFGILSDKVGRKPSLVLSTFFAAVFGVLSCLSESFFFFVFCRFFVGFSAGSAGIPFSLFVEYLPNDKMRGFWLTFIQIFWSFGSIFEALLGWMVLPTSFGINDSDVNNNWKCYVFYSTVPVFIVIPFLPFLPESIRFLCLHNKRKKSKEIIHSMEKLNCRTIPKPYEIVSHQEEEDDDDQKGDDVAGIEKEEESKEKKHSLFKDLFQNRELLIIFLNGSVFLTLGTVVYYGVALLTPDLYSNDLDMYFGVFLNTIVEIPGLLLSMFLLPFIPRRTLQAIFFAISSIGLFSLCFFPSSSTSSSTMTIMNDDDSGNLKWIHMFSMITRASVLAGTCVSWILLQESLPTSARSTGFGFASAISKIGCIMVPVFCKIKEQEQGQEGDLMIFSKLIFAVLAVLAAFSSYFHPVESQHLNLIDLPKRIKEEKLRKQQKKQRKKVTRRLKKRVF